MTWLPLQSVRARLWSALALLSFAVVCISAVTWLSLEHVDERLQELHTQTLSQVAQALELSKRSTDLATSAPYLLNQRSNFLINQEGQKLLEALDSVRVDWPTSQFGAGVAENDVVDEAIDRVATGVSDLITASSSLDFIQSELRALTSMLGDLREQAGSKINDEQVEDRQRLIWWRLQSMTSDAFNAAYAGNLIGVGEEHRHFLEQRRSLVLQSLTSDQTVFLRQLDQIVGGSSGIFELRRGELSTVLRAQNALFRIRHDAGLISTSASNFAAAAEHYLAAERHSSSSAIELTKFVVIVIALASLFLAVVSAIYVSRYITFNMARISSAMVQLAGGDRSSSLPRKVTTRDEIGDLFRSFRSFRANALRLDRSNRQLHQQNMLFQKVFTNISDGIAITDASGRLTAKNPALDTILGLQVGQRISTSFVTLLSQGRFGNAALEVGLADDHRGYCELVSDDGQLVELRASQLPDEGRVWLCCDVTERRKLTDRLQQIDRIETLGKVAGDTAHDFGNILSTIGTHVHLLEGVDGEKKKTTLSAINNAIEYGSSLTQRLLAFAKKQHLVPEIVDLNALVEGMADLVEISLKRDVDFRVTYAPGPVNVLVDPGQLESSLLNLVLNANQAIEGSGTISLKLGMDAEGTACIKIEDTGAGMSAEIVNRVVEPFFTTRSGEGGTGLGLSIAYGFIRQTGGDLKISSSVGSGTRIEITLPTAASIPDIGKPYGGKLALLVEDEAKARTHAKNCLEALGFAVTDIADGQVALQSMNETAYDLFVTDINLGGCTDGWKLVDQFLEQNPAKGALVVSGRLPESGGSEQLTGDRVQCLPKPLDLSALRDAVARVFDDADCRVQELVH